MKYNPPHRTYILMLVISLAVTSCTFLIHNDSWKTIVASIGAGGIASVGVAWMLDIRSSKIRAIEDNRKNEIIMNQFVGIYRRLMWVTANECYGFYEENENRSFQSWLSLLSTMPPQVSKRRTDLNENALHAHLRQYHCITAPDRNLSVTKRNPGVLRFSTG